VVKYERKPMSTNSLFDLAKPFGTICENLILKNKVESACMNSYSRSKVMIMK